MHLLRGTLSPIGLDLGAHSIKAVQLVGRGRSWEAVAACRLPRTSPGAALDVEELSRLRDSLARQGFVGREVVVSAPWQIVKTATLELPTRMAQVPMDEIARAEFCRIHKADAGAITMSYWELPMSVRTRKGTTALAAGCLANEVDSFMDLIESAGFTVEAVDAGASASARACLSLAKDDREMTALVDLGWTAGSVAVIKGGVLVCERRIPETGLCHLIKSFGEENEIAARDVEYLMERAGMPRADGEGVEDESLNEDCRARITAHFTKSVEDIGQSLAYAKHQYPDAQLTNLLLTGGGAEMAGLKPLLESALSLSVRALPASEIVKFPDSLKPAACASLIGAVGLAQFSGR